MKPLRPLFFVVVTLVVSVGAGCNPPVQNVSGLVPSTKPNVSSSSTGMTDAVERGSYVRFSKEAFEAAKTAHQPMLLFFYADWCPYCREQDPRLVALFAKEKLNIVAFKVDYNDSAATSDEKNLARAFGVSQQHTFILLNAAGEEVTRRIGTMSDDETKAFVAKVQ